MAENTPEPNENEPLTSPETVNTTPEAASAASETVNAVSEGTNAAPETANVTSETTNAAPETATTAPEAAPSRPASARGLAWSSLPDYIPGRGANLRKHQEAIASGVVFADADVASEETPETTGMEASEGDAGGAGGTGGAPGNGPGNAPKGKLHIPEHNPNEASMWWMQVRDTRSTTARRRSHRKRRLQFYYMLMVTFTIAGVILVALGSLIRYYFFSDARDVFVSKAKEVVRFEPLHQSTVRSLAFSTDGRYLVSTSEDRTAILWDAQTGEKLRILEGHADAVTCVAVGNLPETAMGGNTPLGRLLVMTGSKDRYSILWNVDVNPAKPIYRLGEQPPLESAKADVEDASDNELTHILDDNVSGGGSSTSSRHLGAVTCVALSADGQTAMSGSSDHSVFLWNVNSGSRSHVVSMHSDTVQAVAFSPDGKYYATAGSDSKVYVWNTVDNTLAYALSGHSGSVTSLCFSKDGFRLLSGSRDNTAVLWDTISGRPLNKLFGKTEMTTVFLSPDSHYAVTNVHENAVDLWDMDTSTKLIQVLTNAPILAFAVSPVVDSTGRPMFAAVVTTDNRIAIYSLLENTKQ